MEILSPLLGVLSIAAFWILAIGLIKPSWMRAANRKQVLKRMGIAFAVLVFAVFINPTPPVNKDKQEVKTESNLASNAEQENEKLRQALEQAKLEAQNSKDDAEKARAEADKLEAEKAKAEADRLEAEKAKAEADRLEAEKAKAEAERLEAEKAKSIAEAARIETEKAKAETITKVEEPKLQPVMATDNVLTGKVISVADGDTITILSADNTQYKIRLHQIDAPEKGQGFGSASKKSLSNMVYKKEVTIEKVDTDKYGRIVGKVLLDGEDINLKQVQNGMAWVYKEYARDQSYFDAETTAKNGRSGLWDNPNAVAPWEFRRGVKETLQPAAIIETPAAVTSSSESDCGSKRFCKEMTSCEEAMHYLNDCGLSKLDRDHDGKPCENVCN